MKKMLKILIPMAVLTLALALLLGGCRGRAAVADTKNDATPAARDAAAAEAGADELRVENRDEKKTPDGAPERPGKRTRGGEDDPESSAEPGVEPSAEPGAESSAEPTAAPSSAPAPATTPAPAPATTPAPSSAPAPATTPAPSSAPAPTPAPTPKPSNPTPAPTPKPTAAPTSTETPDHEHHWTETKRVDPTCETGGYRECVCSCGASQYEQLTPLGHDWQPIYEEGETYPVYGEAECHAFCGVCGMDMTVAGFSNADIGDHMKAHALAGEGDRYYSTAVYPLIGYETEHILVGYVCSRCGATKNP